MSIAGLSDLGKVREIQEDAWLAREPSTGPERRRYGRLIVVADGIGGSQAGEVASNLAVETVADTYFSRTEDTRARLRGAIQAANQRVLEQTETNPAYRGMGTTIVAAVIQGDRLLVGWLGDSRAYLIRQKSVIPVTRDHSRGGGITRWVGMGIMVDPDLREVQLQPGDIVLLCTDGLHNLVREEEIVRGGKGSLEKWTEELVQLALKRGAPDNVTVVCARIDRLPFAPHRHPEIEPGAVIDGMEVQAPLGSDPLHLWYRARRQGAARLLCVLRPELQTDPGLILDLEEEEESLARLNDPAAAAVELRDAEKSLAYVCLRLPWESPGAVNPRMPGGGGLHSLEEAMQILGSEGVSGGTADPRLALTIVLCVARALAAVRASLQPAGAPHPSDFWGDGERYALCRWPAVRRQYSTSTGRGMQVDASLQDYMPPDYGPQDRPGPASDAFFVGRLLQRLLGGPGAEGRLPAPVRDLIAGLLADTTRQRPEAVAAIEALMF